MWGGGGVNNLPPFKIWIDNFDTFPDGKVFASMSQKSFRGKLSVIQKTRITMNFHKKQDLYSFCRVNPVFFIDYKGMLDQMKTVN